jgi:hypothetical protein
VIHDRDRIFSGELDEAVRAMGVRILRTPVRALESVFECTVPGFGYVRITARARGAAPG